MPMLYAQRQFPTRNTKLGYSMWASTTITAYEELKLEGRINIRNRTGRTVGSRAGQIKLWFRPEALLSK